MHMRKQTKWECSSKQNQIYIEMRDNLIIALFFRLKVTFLKEWQNICKLINANHK